MRTISGLCPRIGSPSAVSEATLRTGVGAATARDLPSAEHRSWGGDV